MPGEIDVLLQTVTAQMIAPGSRFELTEIERNGRRLPAYRNAPENMAALFDICCAENADLEFLIDGDVRLTFSQVHAAAIRVAATLIDRHGVRRGDRVGIAAHNSANWIIVYMGVLMAGGCATLINGWWSAQEIAGGVRLAECSLLLCDPERASRIAGCAMGSRVIVFDHGHPRSGLGELMSSADARLPRLTGDDLATIVFTSGSTGIAKGAVTDHVALSQAATSFAAFSAIGMEVSKRLRNIPALPQPATLLNMPLFHVAGEVAQLLQSFLIGRKLVIMARWDALEAMRLIEREGVIGMLGVPLMVLDLATHPDRHRFDMSQLRLLVSGGSAAPAHLPARVCEGLPGRAAVQGYALTETNSVGCANGGENFARKPTSVGPAGAPTVEVAVFGPDGTALPSGMRGEVAIRSICNFREYWRNPEETRAAVRHDGFFLTGDLGYVDDDGYLFVVDRKKDIIIRGGENISSIEVEQRLYAHPAIAEASVFGLPDPRYGEVSVAVVSVRGDATPCEHELRAHVGAGIASFKVPARIWSEAGALPRLGSGKIDKQALKARYSRDWEAAKAIG